MESVTHLHICKCALRASCDCMYTWMYVCTYMWSKQNIWMYIYGVCDSFTHIQMCIETSLWLRCRCIYRVRDSFAHMQMCTESVMRLYVYVNVCIHIYVEQTAHLCIDQLVANYKHTCKCSHELLTSSWLYVCTCMWSNQSYVDVYMESVTHLHEHKCALRVCCDSYGDVYIESVTHLHICKCALRASCHCIYTWMYVYKYMWSKQSYLDVYMESVTHLHIYKCALRVSCDCIYTWMYVYTYTWSKQSDVDVHMESVTHLHVYTCVYIQSHDTSSVIYKQSRDTSSDCLSLSAVYKQAHGRQTVTWKTNSHMSRHATVCLSVLYTNRHMKDKQSHDAHVTVCIYHWETNLWVFIYSTERQTVTWRSYTCIVYSIEVN